MKWVCGEWLVEDLVKLDVPKQNIYVVEDRKTYDLGAFNLTPIATIHDVRNMSYKVDFKPITVYYATDTNKLDYLECLKHLDYYFVEVNYDEKTLQKHIEESIENHDSNIFYLERVRETHLSKEECMSFLIENMGNNSQFVELHHSSYNYEK
jgi:hypothetical protein